jgi:hypothetical protein
MCFGCVCLIYFAKYNFLYVIYDLSKTFPVLVVHSFLVKGNIPSLYDYIKVSLFFCLWDVRIVSHFELLQEDYEEYCYILLCKCIILFFLIKQFTCYFQVDHQINNQQGMRISFPH